MLIVDITVVKILIILHVKIRIQAVVNILNQ